MKNLNIVKGEAKIRPVERTDMKFFITFDESPRIDVTGRSSIEAKSNASLIVEAFNVANETGLSPQVMKERIKKLEHALTIAKEMIPKNVPLFKDECILIDEALKGGKNEG